MALFLSWKLSWDPPTPAPDIVTTLLLWEWVSVKLAELAEGLFRYPLLCGDFFVFIFKLSNHETTNCDLGNSI